MEKLEISSPKSLADVPPLRHMLTTNDAALYHSRPLLYVVVTTLLLAACSLGKYNQVLVGVREHDLNRIRAAARAGTIDERGERDIDRSNICGARALHLAIQEGHVDSLEVLVQEGANLNLPSDAPREPSFCASASSTVELVPPGYPPLHYALKRGNLKMAEVLLFAGADISKTDPEGRTALALARERPGFERLASYMAAPVHLAARVGDLGALRRLHAAGAPLDSPLAPNGPRPLEVALEARQWPAVEFLILQNADAFEQLYSADARQGARDLLLENPGSAIEERVKRLTNLPLR
jgi:ankyrin repeat protein